MVSYIASPEEITPPGEFTYRLMSRSGSSRSRYSNCAIIALDTWSSIDVPRKTMRSLSRSEYMSNACLPGRSSPPPWVLCFEVCQSLVWPSVPSGTASSSSFPPELSSGGSIVTNSRSRSTAFSFLMPWLRFSLLSAEFSSRLSSVGQLAAGRGNHPLQSFLDLIL